MSASLPQTLRRERLLSSPNPKTAQRPGTERIYHEAFGICHWYSGARGSLAMAQYSTWTADPNHSAVEFVVRHAGVSNVHGRFGDVAASLSLQRGRRHQVHRNGHRRRHHRGHRQAPATPISRPTRSSISPSSPPPPSPAPAWSRTATSLTINGNFTLHGVTKPVVLDCGRPRDADREWHGSQAALRLLRHHHPQPDRLRNRHQLPAAMVGDDVKLTIELEIIKQEAAAKVTGAAIQGTDASACS